MAAIDARTRRWRLAGWGAAALILLHPLTLMPLTDAIGWGPEDFVAAALMLGAAGLAAETVARNVRGRTARMAAVALVALSLLVVWAELAVGLLD